MDIHCLNEYDLNQEPRFLNYSAEKRALSPILRYSELPWRFPSQQETQAPNLGI